MSSETAIKPIRLAILEADTPIPSIAAKWESYGQVFKDLFQRACDSLDPPASLESQLDITSHLVVYVDGHRPSSSDLYPDLENIDAILITGSKHNAYENPEWIKELVDYTKRCLDSHHVRVVGVCFGHQIVARALGVEVGQNERGWELSVVQCELTDEGKEIFGLEKMSIQQMHRDIVLSSPPKGIKQLASTETCSNQSMYQAKRLITVQGHPEFTAEITSEILKARRLANAIPEGLFQDGMGRATGSHDGVAIARAFLKFLRE
ncbi:class I glutamine amidotransferase-like protein [Biscogniauxia marginata]|nr:class I glutamine amidotransferase-like protein [Biscogniauxia marginata]